MDTEADILALQEIENSAAIQKLIEYLPGWNYFLDSNGYVLNQGYIYNQRVVLYDPKQITSIRVLENKTRPGFAISGIVGNFDFKMINLHFKSTSRYDDTPKKKKLSFELRQKQSLELNNWITQELKSNEQDLIILGDLNDNPNREWSDNLSLLKNNSKISFITSDLESCKNPNWDNIDHIILSKSAKNRFIKGSSGMYNFNLDLPDELSKKISDHCPVIATFEIKSPDND